MSCVCFFKLACDLRAPLSTSTPPVPRSTSHFAMISTVLVGRLCGPRSLSLHACSSGHSTGQHSPMCSTRASLCGGPVACASDAAVSMVSTRIGAGTLRMRLRGAEPRSLAACHIRSLMEVSPVGNQICSDRGRVAHGRQLSCIFRPSMHGETCHLCFAYACLVVFELRSSTTVSQIAVWLHMVASGLAFFLVRLMARLVICVLHTHAWLCSNSGASLVRP